MRGREYVASVTGSRSDNYLQVANTQSMEWMGGCQAIRPLWRCFAAADASHISIRDTSATEAVSCTFQVSGACVSVWGRGIRGGSRRRSGQSSVESAGLPKDSCGAIAFWVVSGADSGGSGALAMSNDENRH
jgi:hypothetical protein